MSCRQCCGLEKVFGEAAARSDLRRFRSRGPRRTTRLLIEALTAEGVEGATLIDIGGGVGAVPLALLREGAVSARLVDASPAYLAAAREEAERQGLTERMSFMHGDFAAVASDVPASDVVTLDRVICCYDDVEALVLTSASHAGRLYGLVYPRDTWWNRLGSGAVNFFFGLGRTGYRSFVHSHASVVRLVREAGLGLVYRREAGIWQVAVFRRGEQA